MPVIVDSPPRADNRLPVVVARPQRGGLANRLFPWARAVVHARGSGAPMLATRWWQLAVGPVLRGERDARLYTGLFRPEPWAVSMPRRARVGWPTLTEPGTLGVVPHYVRRPGLMVFSGLADYFDRLAPHRALIAESLEAITSVDISQPEHPVVAHIRRGDFPTHIRTPDEWFLRVAATLRSLGYDRPIDLVSDGTDDELAPFFDEGFVIQREATALGDLWKLAGAEVVIASGASTFSSWGAFLGAGLTIAPRHVDFTGLDAAFPERIQRVDHVGMAMMREIDVRLGDAAR